MATEVINEVKIETDVEKKETPESDTNNVFAYLNRSDFTSEKYKIEINGLPKYYGISELKKLIKDKLKLDCNKIKTPRKGSHFAYICFRSEEDRVNGLKILNGYQWKGKVLSAQEADAAPDPLVKKRKEFESGENSNKKLKLSGTQQERLQASTIPYAEFSYEKQLEMKQSDVHQILLKLGNELWKNNQVLRPWIEKQREKFNGLPCELWNIRSAKKYNEYRTKCEFTVGMDYETKLPTVGFRLGSYVDGFTGVAPVDDLIHIPNRIKVAVKVFQNFVRNYDLRIFNPEFQSGEFKQLTTRWSTTSDELMLIIGIQTKDISDDIVSKLKKDLITYFTEGDGAETKVTSLFIKTIQKRQAGEPIPLPVHLYGTTFIQETLLDLTFRISPDAFFQINTEAAEVLYSSAIEIMKPTTETSVVDICCGTGTIGLCFSKHCGQVLGLELVSEAVVDAKANADTNNVTNAEFFQGKAEEILLSVARKAKFDDVIAIVDPPRAGLHQKAVIQLRQTHKLKKLLYISCDSNAALKNFVDLGRPPSKTLHNEPFIPVKAVAVDLFPHTKHCEVLIYFERFNLSMLDKLNDTVPDGEANKDEISDKNADEVEQEITECVK